MKPIRALFSILFMILLPALALAAKPIPAPLTVRGTIMSAETNKPLAGVAISFLGRGEKQKPPALAATANSAADGTFSVSLKPGYYSWLAKAEGYGLYQGGISVANKQTETLSAYLRKEAKISGRLVNGNGTAMPGITVQIGAWAKASSGPDGRFTITGLDARGYEPKLFHPGWVLEKSSYLYLSAGETKDLGDVVMRRSATLTVRVHPKTGTKRPLDRVSLSLSGTSLYRSASTTTQPQAVFSDLPPGHLSLSTSDERLTGTTTELDLGEGENRTLTLETYVKPPSLNIEDYGDVFLPDKALKLRVYGLWMEKAEARISTVAPDALLNGTADLRQPDSIPGAVLQRLTSFPITFKARRDGYTRTTRIPIPGLKPGGYLLEVSGNGATARFGFLVTRLALVAKTSPNATLLYATDLINGKALPGITIGSSQGGPMVTSNADGTVAWDTASKARRLAGRRGDSLAFLELGSAEENQKPAQLKGYLYTDRPAYRPGQTVYFKGVLRQRDGEGYALPSVERVHVTISDSGDKAVCEQDSSVSSGGSFQGECTLAAGTALGGYTINASAGAEIWQGWFKVLEYRKPEFEVRQTADRRFLVAGDTAQVKLSARYYFGAAVAGGKVTWRIYTQPAWGVGQDGDDNDGNGGEERSSGGYSDFIGEGEARLDDNGETIIPISAKTHDMPYTYTLEADVTDASSRQVVSSSSLTVVPSLVALNVKSGSYLTKPGATVDISLRTASWEGEPLSRPVTLEFEQQQYDKKNRSYSWKRIDSAGMTTAVNGMAHTTFTFPHSGYWQIKARTTDQAGRMATDTASVWVWNEGYDWEGSYRDLEAEFDRKQYKPGDTARLIVRSPSTGGSLLLTLEGRDIQSRRTIPLKSMVEVVDIPVTEAYAPNIQVSAVTIANGRFFSRTLPLRVALQPSKLDISVKADKQIYAPGDRVHLTISSTSARRAVPAEFSLAVVDEAIFAVAPERRDDIYQFFRGNREHLVSTLYSFPRVYLGGAAKDAAALSAKEDDLKGLKLRKTFKDTAFWQPLLTGNADGSASADFTLPDNLTTWRATAVGHSPVSEFGTGREKFIARLDLMARLAPPRFMTVGDELKIPGVISSMTDSQQAAKGRFEASGLTLLGEAEFSGIVPPRGTLRHDLLLRADKPGSATLRLLARGTQSGDAMELNLPLLERGIYRTMDSGIVVREQQGSTELVLPDNALPGSGELRISVAPGIATSLNSAIARLVQFPYGCVEQTLSRFIPAVHARALLTRTAWQPDAATAEKLPLAIAEGIKRLEDMQHGDGGWGWWKQDRTSLTMTSHALYGLGLAKQAGLEVPPQMLQQGLKALETLVQNAPRDELPRAYRAMVINGARNEALETRIRSGWKNLAVADQLVFCEALGLAGVKDGLIPLLDELKRDLHSEGTAAYILDRDADSWWYGWRWGSSAVETTSSLLSLTVKQNPSDPLASRLAEFLARRQSGGWWQTTTSSAAAVTALADYVSATGEGEGSYSARLTLNDRELASYRVEGGALVAGERQLTIPAQGLATGVNTLTLTKQGKGAAYLSAALAYAAPPESNRSSPGLKLERSLYRMTSVKNGSTWRREYTPLKPGQPVAPGDDIEVRLSVENDKALEYVIIEDRLPAGFESRETDRDPRFMDESSFFNWYSHRERRDEKMAFFISALPVGRHEFRHLIYPELEGTAMALPAAVWPMYQPLLRGESRPWQMDVRGR
ncbi:MAG: carboxypeptidase regulatory-like domain-containing protein [Desulfuromonadales bacterium]|nr:carboxypeptidase regulatory-like domain-containing protein [Desulfuromonadales bacterium]